MPVNLPFGDNFPSGYLAGLVIGVALFLFVHWLSGCGKDDEE